MVRHLDMRQGMSPGGLGREDGATTGKGPGSFVDLPEMGSYGGKSKLPCLGCCYFGSLSHAVKPES